MSAWFYDLSILKGVPFNYLVPDERMLPKESLRCFWIDPFWVRCLLDGALSISRVLTSDHPSDEPEHDAPVSADVTGFRVFLNHPEADAEGA